ncbi:MAG: Crp/Fnr family transcriptional regulator [Oscillospiraceae bacterium]|nr:Crp/Fnr family transcriptional regulator [Oscillospiraceae bacterium]
MKKYISVLKNSPVFSDISETEIELLSNCMQPKIRRYKKGEYIFSQGDSPRYLTILLEGSLHIQRDDFWGNRSIVSVIEAGDMFGESYALANRKVMLNDAVAVEDCVAGFFDIKALLTTCSSSCPFHAKVIQNLFVALSEKNIRLVQKMGHISQRSTREKLISYLSEQAALSHSESFTIPFNRQQLADFLSVDRSAMSNELCKMRDEGLLYFHKNQFTLL